MGRYDLPAHLRHGLARALRDLCGREPTFRLPPLAATPIREETADRASGIKECVSLLGRPFILLCFLGIMCHVGIDVGTNTTAPKIIMERPGLPLEEAGFATSVYFIFRTAGCFTGALHTACRQARVFFGFSVALMLVAMGMLAVGNSLAL